MHYFPINRIVEYNGYSSFLHFDLLLKNKSRIENVGIVEFDFHNSKIGLTHGLVSETNGKCVQL